MENEDVQSVSKNEIDASIKQDTSSEETALNKCALDKYDSRKLKVSLLKLNLGMPEDSGGAADCEKDLEESSPSAEKKINGEVTESAPKENGSSTGEVDHEMAPLSIDVEEEGRTGDSKKVDSSLKRKLEDSTNLQDSSSSDDEAHSNSPVEFRGFKKRMIAKAEKSLHRQRQVSETENCQMQVEATPEDDSVAENENSRVLRSRSKICGANDKESGDQLTEYAQYLGLQPTVKFKCYRCGEKNFQTMAALNDHQTNCTKATSNTATTAAKPLLSPQIDPSNPSTNFRITRKVFLCSACGTYYENWKLFLHMREVHKRHICLYCLGMFAAADKLAEHLVLKHKVTYQSCDSPEEFLSVTKGSGYLTCVTCERMFTERENFFHHECSTTTVTNCSKQSTQVRTTKQPDITLNRNSQLIAKAGSTITVNRSSSSTASGSITKRFVSVPTLVRENWSGKPPPSSDFIDVSNFCRVDLEDTQSDSSKKPPPSVDKNTIVVSDEDEETSPTKTTQSTRTNPPAQKAIQRMFPTLRRLSDLMEKKDEKSSTSKTDIETPTKENVNLDKNENSQSDLKNRKPTQIELPQARKNPLRLTRSTKGVSFSVSNLLETKIKTQVKESIDESSSSDIESIDMDLAKENEAISREAEDKSYCTRDNAQKEKNSKTINNSTLDNTRTLFAHSPPLLMEVVNESDNESPDEEEPVSNRCQTATNPVHSTSKAEEIRKITEVNKIVIGEIVEKNLVDVSESQIEEAHKDKTEKKVDETNKSEVINEKKELEKSQDEDENKKLEKPQIEEDENKKIEKSPVRENEPNLNETSPTEKSVETNSDSIVEKVVPNGSPSISQERSIVPYEDSENESESEDDQPAKEIEESNEEPDRLDNESNVDRDDDKSNEERNKVDSDESEPEHDKVDDKCNNEHDEVDSDESSVENDKVSDESDVEQNKVDGESNEEHNEVDDESNLEHGKVEDKSDNEDNIVDDESEEERRESNNEEHNEQNGMIESVNENNNKSSNNEDNESVDSEDSDKLSGALSEESSDNENSKSENDDTETENRNNTKSNEDNTGQSESESQAMTNHSEELMNGGIDESESQKAEDVEETSFSFEGETLQIASKEVMAMALTLEDKMESLSAQSVIKECIRTSCTTCGYCNHAVKIGVNGKQLAAHLLAEHRYKPVKNETVQDVIDRLKHALSELKDVWFNTDSYDSSDKSCFVPFDRTYECFQCNFVTNMLKDLISHKRKVHQKTILYCSMCKANFYSYSELLCHMCPGLYVSEDIQFRCCLCEIDRIPSAFRLMVHLRKIHHTCDVCLEIPGDQQKLSTHMWKHKLHHICYRCGIAYRNKPDITKHLFWKHGNESVLCKKCLQKKWPHVYHFCIPPTVFICEECNISFSRAVALKVHKRIHAGDFPYSCTECSKKFVSRKILDKHVESHREPIVQDQVDKNEISEVTNRSEECKEADTESVNKTCDNSESDQVDGDNKNSAEKKHEQSEEHLSKSHKKKSKKDRDKKSKPVVDVYDLPPLNLSSESDDSDDEMNSTKTTDNVSTTAVVSSSDLSSLTVENSSEPKVPDVSEKEENSVIDGIDSNVPSAIVTEPTETFNTSEDNLQSAPVVDGIWDNFHFYKAEQEKRESSDPNSKPPRLPYPLSALPDEVSTAIILGDHDYCLVPADRQENTTLPTTPPSNSQQPREHSSSMDHDYCTVSNAGSKSARKDLDNGERSALQVENKSPASTPKKKQKSPKKSEKHNSSSSSDSSSDSDSSSCSNSNCSCCSSGSGSSSSSSSDSDSSSSEGKRGKRDRKKEKTKSKKKDDSLSVAPEVQEKEEEPVVDLAVEPEEPPIRESDLDTDESSTEEDFYDQYPQRHANQMLAEKRNQLMVLAAVAPVNNGISSPPPEETPPTPVSAPPILQTSSPVPVVEENTPKANPVQRRGRKKRKRGGGQTKNQNTTTTPSQLTYEAQPSTSFALTTPSVSSPVSQYSTPQHNSKGRKKSRPSVETDSSKRLSKRRRVPNKFYGYSSDEEEEIQQAQRPSPATVTTAKWRRVEETPPQSEPVRYRVEDSVTPQYSGEVRRPPAPATAAASSSGSSSSNSSGSSGSESESEPDPIAPPPTVVFNQPRTEKDEKLYCYCQCPYDEVSEMIACDGHDCNIEWFHFECVGIMVPPKGKWFCPDCKRRRNLI